MGGRRNGGEEARRRFFARGVKKARMAQGEPGGPEPSDEIDALRARLLAELRRRPGDLGVLMRRAEAVTRLMVGQGRLAPAKEQQLRRNLELLAEYFDSMLVEGNEAGK